jgi:hypothetical protein
MPNPLWLRAFFAVVLLQALLVGSALIQPSWISLVLPWPASPLNARFIAALYLMGAISAALCLFANRIAAVRIPLLQIGFVTGALLLITIPHFGEFNRATFPYRWTVFYTVDPVLAFAIAWVLRGRDRARGPNPNVFLFMAYAGVLCIAGLVLLLLPAVAVATWPWSLPPVLGQVYSVFFFTCALGAVLAARDPRWTGIWIYCAANAGMFVLVLLVSLYHKDRFVSGPPTAIWFGLWIVALAAFTLPFLRRAREVPPQKVFT